jgi:ketosteroid isomerase-like protein
MSVKDVIDKNAEEAIRRTLAEYCALVDEGDFRHWAELFTVTAVLRGNGALIAEGREGIRRWVTEAVPSRSGGKHITVNSIIRLAGRSASISSDFFFLAPSQEGPVLAAAGKYIDKIVSDQDRWRFAEREILMPAGWIRPAAFAGKSD